MKILNAILGCILGGAIGDAAGSCCEGGGDASADWQLTDDTQFCRITHQHEEAYVGALAVVLAIQSPVASLEEIAAQLPDTVVRDRLVALEGRSIFEAGRRNGVSGYVADSVPFALFASRQVPHIGFLSMLEQVIAAGGDTDTNASLACQIVGAALGLSCLPQAALERLPDREVVLGIARRFGVAVAAR